MTTSLRIHQNEGKNVICGGWAMHRALVIGREQNCLFVCGGLVVAGCRFVKEPSTGGPSSVSNSLINDSMDPSVFGTFAFKGSYVIAAFLLVFFFQSKPNKTA